MKLITLVLATATFAAICVYPSIKDARDEKTAIAHAQNMAATLNGKQASVLSIPESYWDSDGNYQGQDVVLQYKNGDTAKVSFDQQGDPAAWSMLAPGDNVKLVAQRGKLNLTGVWGFVSPERLFTEAQLKYRKDYRGEIPLNSMADPADWFGNTNEIFQAVSEDVSVGRTGTRRATYLIERVNTGERFRQQESGAPIKPRYKIGNTFVFRR